MEKKKWFMLTPHVVKKLLPRQWIHHKLSKVKIYTIMNNGEHIHTDEHLLKDKKHDNI